MLIAREARFSQRVEFNLGKDQDYKGHPVKHKSIPDKVIDLQQEVTQNNLYSQRILWAILQILLNSRRIVL
jgi:hypothetical protein